MKTIEEAAKERALRYAPVLWEEQAAAYFISGVEFAQRWIPVEEELPAEGVDILVKVSFGAFGETKEVGVTQRKNGNFLHYRGDWITVTHWRYVELH